jgi:S1-C subfamily serine protease
MNANQIAATLILCGLTGCATPSTMLVNNQGQVARCAAAGWGWAGAPLAVQAEQRCVDDAKRIGFSELPPMRLGAVFDFRSSPALVSQVLPGSPAEKAGLRAGDSVVNIDGRSSPNIGDFVAVTGGKKPGDTVALLIARGGQQSAISVFIAP